MLAAEIKTAPAALSFPDSSLAWKQIVEPAEPFLKAVTQRLIEQVNEFEPSIGACARYALAAQGKQLRPLLVVLTAQAAGKLEDAHITVAVIIEMVHLATLVHDDVIDDGEIRRGRPTLAANWGNEISVLLGDCLFAQALKLASSFPTPEICRSVAAATHTVCSGEILQTQRRRDFRISRPDYFKLVAMKTAELFALSCDLGALLAGARAGQREVLRKFGVSLGTAYQIYDDCVDLFGSERDAGKSLGTDLAKGKLTLPVLLALERADEKENNWLQHCIQNWKPELLAGLLERLENCDALNESRRIIRGYLTEARQGLSSLPVSGGRLGPAGLKDYLDKQADLLNFKF